MFEIEPAPSVVPRRARPVLAPALDRAVERHWLAARAENPALFNGTVFSVDTVGRAELRGHWTEYRRVVARLRDPGLAGALGVRPLAVAGLIEGPDGIVFGRRPAGAVYQPGLWQLAPAGNVDPQAEAGGRIDPGAALALELREELGLDAHSVRAAGALCLVEHPGIGVLDLCIALRTTLSEAAIREAHARFGDGEYPALAVVPRAALDRFMREQAAWMAPQARLFLDRYLGGSEPGG